MSHTALSACVLLNLLGFLGLAWVIRILDSKSSAINGMMDRIKELQQRVHVLESGTLRDITARLKSIEEAKPQEQEKDPPVRQFRTASDFRKFMEPV